jgi:hypothetical protein
VVITDRSAVGLNWADSGLTAVAGEGPKCANTGHSPAASQTRQNDPMGRSCRFPARITFWVLIDRRSEMDERLKPDCCSSGTLRLSGQPQAYNHNEPKEGRDHAGCDANRRADG